MYDNDFERIDNDEESLRIRDDRSLHLETVRSPRTPPGSLEVTSSGGLKIGNPGRKKEPEDPVQKMIKKYSWILQLVCVNLLYFYSLTTCEYSNRKCQQLHGKHIKYWVIALLLAGYIFTTKILTTFNALMADWMIHGKPSHKVNLMTFGTLLNYFWLCSLNEGLTYKSHGTFSRIVFNYLSMLIMAVRGFNAVMRFAQTKGYKSVRVVGSVIFYGLLVMFVWGRVVGSKDDYFRGFDNEKASDKPPLCNFHKIGVNYYSAFDELFWNFAHSNADCNRRSREKEWWKNLGPSVEGKVLAYPTTTGFSNTVRQHYQLLQEEVMKQIKVVDPSRVQQSESEVYLDLSTGEPTIKIDVKYRQAVVDQAKAMRAKEPGLARPNVLVLTIDSLSRQHFFRKMKKSAAYFDERHFKSKDKLHGYQFFRYHALADHAEPNLLALRYDDVVDSEHDPKTRIENYFKDQGWITSSTSAKCEIEEWDIEKDRKNKIYVDRIPADHEFYSLACDPNSMPQKDPFGMFKGPFSEFRRCLYGKDSSEYQFEYALDFWRKYKSEPKFQSITLTDGHEFTGELPYYLDKHLEIFFKTMTNEGLLNDSIVYLLSDNGNSGNFLFSGSESGKNEAVNPFMAIFMSDNNAAKYGDALQLNTDKLVTAHDVFRSMAEIGNNLKEYIGSNMFKHELKADRRCDSVDVQIPASYCRCK
jgi:Protein of unknown function (DUF229)